MIDGRLILPAISVWLGALMAALALGLEVSLEARHVTAVWVCTVTVAAGLVLAGCVRFEAPRQIRTVLPRVALVVVSAWLLGVLASGLHVVALTPTPLISWVESRATATVRGVITGEPITRTSRNTAVWQASQQVEVRLATSRVGARGNVVDLSVPLLVRLPDGIPVPPPGSEVEVIGRLGTVPWQSGAAGALTVSGRNANMTVASGPGPVDVVVHAMRLGLRSVLSGVPPDAGALVAGLAVGDETGQSPTLALQMRTSGLSHLTAVSGGNTAIVVAAVLAVGALLRLGLVLRMVTALMALAFFVVLVGPQPSVLRAAAMGGIVLLGMATGGRRAGPSVLAASVLTLVLISPGLAVSWGFALSAGAAAGLILLAPHVRSVLDSWWGTRRWPSALREASALTIAAQLATLPLLVGMGAAVGWVALPANLLAMPAVAPITVLGLVAATLAPIVPGIATVIAQLAAWPAAWIAGVARVCSGLPLARLPWPTGWWGVALLVMAVAVAWFVRRRLLLGLSRPMRLQIVLLGSALLAVVAGLWMVAPPGRRSWPPAGWFMIMCDVGQGDAILVRSGADAAIVVDVGPDPELIDRCLDDAAIASVAAVVLTHFHADHVNGLPGVFRDRAVGAVYVTAVRDPPEQAREVDRWMADLGLTPTVITAGDRRSVGQAEWRALWPRRQISAGSVPNNASIVLDVTVAGHDVLLPGDIESEAQAAVSTELQARRFDVVKVPHHGSAYQNTNFTTWAPAPIALISVGAGNTYGHPAPETIADWKRHGSLVVRTDLNGDVAVVSTDSGLGVVARHGMLPSS